LSEQYKIIPFNYWKYDNLTQTKIRDYEYKNESEERLLTNKDSIPLDKYINGFTVFLTNQKINYKYNTIFDIIKELANKDYLDITQWYIDKKLINLYKNSLAFVYPTLSEGFGLPPMEAVNAGTLSVVSDIPVLKEIYGDSVLYFNPLDQNSIAHTLNEVLVMNKVERQKRLKYGQDFVKKYSWYKMAQETLKIYEQFSK
jgi:glycosyltransferase involved in cell wall biosynthesis